MIKAIPEYIDEIKENVKYEEEKEKEEVNKMIEEINSKVTKYNSKYYNIRDTSKVSWDIQIHPDNINEFEKADNDNQLLEEDDENIVFWKIPF